MYELVEVFTSELLILIAPCIPLAVILFIDLITSDDTSSISTLFFHLMHGISDFGITQPAPPREIEGETILEAVYRPTPGAKWDFVA